MTFEMLDKYLKSKISVVRHHQKDWHWFRYLLYERPFAILNISYDLRPILTLRFPRGMYKKYRENYPGVIVEAIDFPETAFNTIYLDKIEDVISDKMIIRLIDDSYNEVFITLPPKFKALIEDKQELVKYDVDKMYNLDIINKDLSDIIKDIWENYDNNPTSINKFRLKYARKRVASESDLKYAEALFNRKNTQLKRIGEPSMNEDNEL